MPFFSIVIPSYNRAHLIVATIRSVIAQTFTDWELIFIDDGSNDNTAEVVRGCSDQRIKYFYQANTERSTARNNGIERCVGEFICFQDSDDIWANNHLQLLYEEISKRNFEIGFYFTSMRWNFPDGKKDVVFESPEGKNLIEYVINNQIGTPTQCMHYSILRKHKYNPVLKINEDVELCTRIVNEYPLFQISEITVDVIVHKGNTKALEKNYILPQIEAMKLIFSNPLFKNRISAAFKKQRLQNLYHQLVNYYLKSEEFAKMNKEIIRFLVLYPTHGQNKSKIVLLLYHLPGGYFLQKIVSLLKKKK